MNEIISMLNVIIPLLIGVGMGLSILIPALKKLKYDLLEALEDDVLIIDEIMLLIEDSIGILKIWKLFKK